MAHHELKTWPTPWYLAWIGRKTHEIRSTKDRTFEVGDTLVLHEWIPAHEGPCVKGDNGFCRMCGRLPHIDPLPGRYTGRVFEADVTYITRGGEWGLPPDVCVMSILRMPTAKRRVSKKA